MYRTWFGRVTCPCDELTGRDLADRGLKPIECAPASPSCCNAFPIGPARPKIEKPRGRGLALLPFEHEDARLTSARGVRGNGQCLQI